MPQPRENAMPPETCPYCEHSLSQQELTDGWCDDCGKRLPTSVARPVAVEPQRGTGWNRLAGTEDDEDGPRLSRRQVLGWSTVRTGLIQMFVGLILTLLGLAALLLALLTADGFGGSRGEVENILVVAVVGLAAGAVLNFAGVFLSCAAPAGSGARGWAVAATVLLVLQVLLGSMLFVFVRENDRAFDRNFRFRNGFGQPRGLQFQEPPFPPAVLGAISYTILGTSCLGSACFLLFLTAVARHFRRSGLTAHAVVYLVIYLCFSAGVILLTLVSSTGPPGRRGGLPEEVWYGVAGVARALGVWFMVLIGMVRGTITKALLWR